MKLSERTILHCDLNNFYASVECIRNPAYSGIPLAVCGDPAKRHGVILAKNYHAKAFNIKTGDTVNEAYKKCPGLTCVGPHFDLYSKYSDDVFKIYTGYTDKVEPFGNDECWLDVTGSARLLGGGEEIADKIRLKIKKDLGLTVSVGVSFNKIFAKMGSDMKKPDAVTVITNENFRDKIWPLPVSDMMMAGRKTAEKLLKMNIRTIGQLALADSDILTMHLGVNGITLKAYALGQDAEPVRPYTEGHTVKSVGHGTTTIRDVDTPSAAYTVIYFLCDMIASRLRKYGFSALGIHLDMRSADLNHKSRQARLEKPTNHSGDISKAACALLDSNWEKGMKLRTITVSAFNLLTAEDIRQIDFFEDRSQNKKIELDSAIDKIRGKYGYNALTRANLIDNDYIMDRFDNSDFLPFKR